MQPNQNPREMISGWRLHRHAIWVLLVLNLGVPVSSWLPGDWTVMRTLLQILGCFGGGMLVASAGALWQRVDADSIASDMPDRGVRVALTGWRHHPKVARVLLALVAGGVLALACLPKEWVVLSSAALVLGTFAAGGLAARDAAIWERMPATAVGPDADVGSE